MSDFEDREDLGNTSLQRLYEDPKAPAQDERDYSTLTALKRIVDEAESKSIDMRLLNPLHPHLNVEQQSLAYQFALYELILPFKSAVDTAIEKVKKQKTGEE